MCYFVTTSYNASKKCELWFVSQISDFITMSKLVINVSCAEVYKERIFKLKFITENSLDPFVLKVN